MSAQHPLRDRLRLTLNRAMAKGLWPARWVEPDLPEREQRTARSGHLSLEVVSHCWNYAHLLVYQLSSLVLNPPRELSLTMTVVYCTEDAETRRLLDFFASQQVDNVTWNWLALPRQELFRRGIGRNRVALQTCADWVWFTDCDVLFQTGCLDALATQLQGRQDALVFPAVEHCTELLPHDHALMQRGHLAPAVIELGDVALVEIKRTRATGPLQITHGDVCRAIGYCRNMPLYQQPSEIWCKAHEDVAFRWLMRTQGTALPVPGVVRIRHLAKGRYTGNQRNTRLRTWIRQLQKRLREPDARRRGQESDTGPDRK